jgi:hypothetical protein
MVLVKIIGGLGNQLFQIAYAINIAKKNNHKIIYLDISAFDSYKIRSFSANNLNLPSNIAILNNNVISNRHKYTFKLTQISYRVLQKSLKTLHLKSKFGELPFKFLSKFGLLYNFDNFFYETPKSKSDILCVYGYFQSEKYFRDIKSEIYNIFSVKIEPNEIELKYISLMSSYTSIAVSMRLGDDYKSSKKLNVCNKKFYIDGINELKERFEHARFFIFSDDIDRAKEYLNQDDSYIYIEDCNDYQSLRLMNKCEHFIISNSSFSWWGAFLSQSKNKVILAPEKWYGHMDKEISIYTNNMEKR